MAQANAEMRRAAAVALEQEMLAKVQEMQAKVIESQAEVPLAMAASFRDCNVGILDTDHGQPVSFYRKRRPSFYSGV